MTTTKRSSQRTIRLAVGITLGVIILFTALFILEFVIASQSRYTDVTDELTEDSYMDVVTALLADASAERGERLVMQTYECAVCHVQAGGQLAPGFDLLGEHARTLRPPLQPAAYLYEAIIYPGIHIVEGYQNAMPANYGDRMTDQELGDMIAYLLQKYVDL